MGFQVGSQIDPRLMAVDYSPLIRSGEIAAASIAGLGKDIGEGIEKYQKNKEITATTLASVEGSVAANPQYLETALAQGGKIAKAAQKLQEGDINRMDLLTLEGFFSTMTKVSQAEAAAKDARLQRENLIARTGASNRSNQPQQITAGTLNSITQSMADAGIKLDAETGQYYREDTGVPMWPFDNKNVPVNFDVKGAGDYSKIYGNPDASQFNLDEWKLVN